MMITDMPIKNQPLINTTPLWQKLLANAYRDPNSLLKELELDTNKLSYSEQANQQFKLLAPNLTSQKYKKGTGMTLYYDKYFP